MNYIQLSYKFAITFTPMGEDIDVMERQSRGIIYTPFEAESLGNQPIECNSYYCSYSLKRLGNE